MACVTVAELKIFDKKDLLVRLRSYIYLDTSALLFWKSPADARMKNKDLFRLVQKEAYPAVVNV